MQRFPCPFCGLRDEREFHFAGELGKVRPDTAGTIDATEWADYLHMQCNDKGASEEVWMHNTCRELFVLNRDTVSMAVLESRALRKELR